MSEKPEKEELVNELPDLYQYIDHVELKTKVLTLDELQNLVATAMVLMTSQEQTYVPILKRIATRIAVLDTYFMFLDEDGNEIDLLYEGFVFDKLYEVSYKFDFDEMLKEVNQKQLQDVISTIEDEVSYNFLQMQIVASSTSKYDEMLDKAILLLQSISQDNQNIDLQEMLGSINRMTDRMNDVTEEQIVRTIIREMNDHPIEDNDGDSEDGSIKN